MNMHICFMHKCICLGLPRWLSRLRICLQCRTHRRHGFYPWVRKTPWKRAWQPVPVFLPGESHGQRSLADYSPQGRKELGMMVGTEHACFSTFHWKSNTASWLIHQTSSKPVQIEAPGFAPEVSFRFPEAMPAHSPVDSPRHLSAALGCRMLPYYWECVCP